MIKLISSEREWEELTQDQATFFLLKHSLTCPISSNAKREYERFSEKSDTPCYLLHVQEARQLSNFIQTEYRVRHESPQALCFKQKEPVWHASHHNITEEALQDVVKGL
ncbi:bacillithiol system redox-active protein YtxJ [Halobacillus sp. B23F22_1]|uniref:bacillithiol system redox-active protein YtxJ n=1 Tax=Halobacillus sp. B23F22_1 TaxID=3459514 RepID=UPI00373E3E50